MIDIVERLITISGEAPIIGEPVYLIRLSGCNIFCPYCDTQSKEEINERITVEDLILEIKNFTKDYPELKILFTGGEPLLEEREEELYLIMKNLNYINFFIETNGTIEIKHFDLNNTHYIVDWKSPSSKFDGFFILENLKKMRFKNDVIKFVVNKEDLEWVKEKIKVINQINPFLKLYISPQFNKISLKDIAEFIIKNKLPLNMSIQLHKLIWPDNDGGV